MKTEPTEAPTLPPGFDADQWIEDVRAAANGFLFARDRYRALPKTPAAVLEALPEGATAQERYDALLAASSAVTTAHNAMSEAGREYRAVTEQFFAACDAYPPANDAAHRIAAYLHDAAERERKEALEADRRAAEVAAVTAKHAAADELEAKRREYEAAQERARQAGIRPF